MKTGVRAATRRDTETGNDDFGARYYSNRFGRWLSADWSNVPVPVPYANLTNPQTLNLYAMVSDDPESFADLDGHLQDPQNGTNTTPANCPNDGVATSNASNCSGVTPSAPVLQAAHAENQAAQIQYLETPNLAAQTLTVTKIETTSTPRSDGSVLTTEVRTTVVFRTDQDHVGEVSSAAQWTSAAVTGTDGKRTVVAESGGVFGDRLTEGAARQAFGDGTFKQYQAMSMPSRGEFFNRSARNDKKGLAIAFGEGVLLATGVPEAYETIKGVGDVALAGYHFIRSWREASHPE